MTYINPIWAEGQRKRWLRHDWRNWVKPEAHHLYEGLEEKRALRFDEVARQRQAEAAEIAAAKREQEALERELLELRWEFKKLKLEYELRRFREKYRLDEKYSPDQPRVPAGNPDGGQWTSGGRAIAPRDRSEPDGVVLSDASPDPVVPGAQYAQSAPTRYSVVLADEEAPKGIGHAIRRHVGKSDRELLDILREDWARYTVGNVEFTEFRLAHGSFVSLESANDFVNRTLESDKRTVDQIASGERDGATLDRRFGYPTGKEAFRPRRRFRAVHPRYL